MPRASPRAVTWDTVLAGEHRPSTWAPERDTGARAPFGAEAFDAEGAGHGGQGGQSSQAMVATARRPSGPGR